MFIKLSLPQEGITRKAVFDRKPTWDQLASKIEVLFSSFMYKADEVAVSYVDSDGDMVTIMSNEELRDFYAQESKMVNSGTIKFDVKRHVPQSVPQVPLDDPDWDTVDQDPLPDDPPLSSIPMFGNDGGIHPMMHNMFAFIPGDGPNVRGGSPAVSEARIEEVPTRSNSLHSTPAPPEPDRRPSPMAKPRDKGKAREINLPEDNNRRFSFSSDVSTPREREKPLQGEAPVASLYSDIANLLLQVTTVLTRVTDGSYLRPGFEVAMDGATSDEAMGVARAALEESAKNVERTLNNIARELPMHPRPMSMGGAPPARDGGRPRPWSMFSSTTQPPFANAPPPPMPNPSRSGGSERERERAPPPFVPPAFINPVDPMTGTPLAPQNPLGTYYPQEGPRATRGPTRLSTYVPPLSAVPASPLTEVHTYPGQFSSPVDGAHHSERERLEAARQQYKMEKANFRAQREVERQEREERKALRDKRVPHLDELAESLEAALGDISHRMSNIDSEEDAPEPIRPSAKPELFVPPIAGMPTVPMPWDEPVINVSVGPGGAWGPKTSTSRPRGPYHEKNERILEGLENMGFSVTSHPEIPGLVKQETRNNLSKSNDEIIDRIVDLLTEERNVRPPPQPRPQASGSRGGRRR